jgi:hypothetical protein
MSVQHDHDRISPPARVELWPPASGANGCDRFDATQIGPAQVYRVTELITLSEFCDSVSDAERDVSALLVCRRLKKVCERNIIDVMEDSDRLASAPCTQRTDFASRCGRATYKYRPTLWCNRLSSTPLLLLRSWT